MLQRIEQVKRRAIFDLIIVNIICLLMINLMSSFFSVICCSHGFMTEALESDIETFLFILL